MGVTLKGADEFQKKLASLKKGGVSVGFASVGAGCAVMVDAMKAEAPGSTKQEIGMSLKRRGDVIRGRAGFVRFPKSSDGQNGPHGVYVNSGTKYITARRFIEKARRSSQARALAAMKMSGKKRIQDIVK